MSLHWDENPRVDQKEFVHTRAVRQHTHTHTHTHNTLILYMFLVRILSIHRTEYSVGIVAYEGQGPRVLSKASQAIVVPILHWCDWLPLPVRIWLPSIVELQE